MYRYIIYFLKLGYELIPILKYYQKYFSYYKYISKCLSLFDDSGWN